MPNTQEKHLMRLEEIVLVLWPVAGKDGWDAYAEIAHDYRKVAALSVERVKFTCEITVSFEPYRHALLNSGNATSFHGDSEEHAPHLKVAHKTQDAIKSAFANLAD